MKDLEALHHALGAFRKRVDAMRDRGRTSRMEQLVTEALLELGLEEHEHRMIDRALQVADFTLVYALLFDIQDRIQKEMAETKPLGPKR